MEHNLTTMIETGLSQLANPECSYLTGALGGMYIFSRFIILFLVGLIIYKVVNTLAIEPLLEWIKNKIYKRSQKSSMKNKRGKNNGKD